MELEWLLKELYKNEINFKIESNWDIGIKTAILDSYGKVIEEKYVSSPTYIPIELTQMVIKIFPESKFARKWKFLLEGVQY